VLSGEEHSGKEGTVVGMGMGTGVLLALALSPAITWGACGGRNIVRDWGLHVAWTTEPDRRHPERPARLLEIPWSAATEAVDPACVPLRSSRGAVTSRPAPEVRAGMRVTVERLEDRGEIHLLGTALGTARRGETVAVRAGFGGATLKGIVRGPGVVELWLAKGGE
jgi:hypothetical protein